jgi:uncharacterized repeat protein (TIGR03803 family)
MSGALYGTTQNGGAQGKGLVFSLDPGTGAEQVLYSFCSKKNCTDGQYPDATLLDVSGTLYGTTFGGGARGSFGTVFALDPSTGTETVVYSFCSQLNCNDGEFPSAALLEAGGTLYGTTSYGGGPGNGGAVFSLDPSTGAMTVVYSFCSQQGCTDGGYPQDGLIEVKGKLYGTTQGGGTFGDDYGTLFAIKNP